MNIPATLTMHKRPVTFPMLRPMFDHTYVLATVPAQPQVIYRFTCFDHTNPLPPLPQPGDLPVVAANNGNVDIPAIVATANRTGGGPAPVVPPVLDYNLPVHCYGMAYLKNGVCHQAANRCLLGTFVAANLRTVRGGKLSSLIYNLYGTPHNFLQCLRRINQIRGVGAVGILGVINAQENNEEEPLISDEEYINSVYKQLMAKMKENGDEFLRKLIELNFINNATQNENNKNRFYLFMDEAFEKKYDGSYKYIEDSELHIIYKAFENFMIQKASLDSRVTDDIDKTYIAGYNSALQSMLGQFFKVLGNARYQKLFNEEYIPDFTFMPEVPMYKDFSSTNSQNITNNI